MGFSGNNGWTGLQYSLWRGLLGIVLASIATWFLTGIAGSTIDAIPPILLLLLCLPLVLGWWDRAASGVVAGLIVFSFVSLDQDKHTGWALAAVLILHTMTPAAPLGSLAARGRTAPRGGWHLSSLVYRSAWWLVFVATVLAAFGLPATIPPGKLTLAIRVVFVAAVVLSVPARSRAVAWLLLTAAWVLLVVSGLSPLVVLTVLPAWLLCVDPAWISPVGDGSAWLFYDGHCGLCHRCVKIALSEDRDGIAFRFGPLGGAAFLREVDEATRKTLPDSLVLVTRDGRVLVRSAAVLGMGQRLGGYWRLLAGAAWLVPAPVRDFCYDLLARLRHRLFPGTATACPLLPRDLQERFDMTPAPDSGESSDE